MEGQTPEVVLELLTPHYDPLYQQSIKKNFVRFPQALPIRLKDRQADALAAAARDIIRSEIQV